MLEHLTRWRWLSGPISWFWLLLFHDLKGVELGVHGFGQVNVCCGQQLCIIAMIRVLILLIRDEHQKPVLVYPNILSCVYLLGCDNTSSEKSGIFEIGIWNDKFKSSMMCKSSTTCMKTAHFIPLRILFTRFYGSHTM